MTKTYRICTKCIMDTSDPDINFDKQGICSHCYRYEGYVRSETYVKKKQPGALETLVEEIKRKGQGKPYDCIIGVSGGVDSTYAAYITKKLGIRPLAVHLDNGWDSELAINNIEKTLRTLNIDLYTYVIDWEEFRDIQLSFLKASTPDSEIPTDHAIIALLYKMAARYKIKFILAGTNTATEGGGVAAWSQGHADWGYIRAIQQLHGSMLFKSYPHYNALAFIYYTIIKGIKWIDILDYVNYEKQNALNILQTKLCWKYYGGKHYESIYTRFFQGYILPQKFGFDKRRLHLSSLIWSGQLSRDQALDEMRKTDYPDDLQQQDKEYVTKKLGITNDMFEGLMNLPRRSFWDYPSYKKIFKNQKIVAIYRFLKRF